MGGVCCGPSAPGDDEIAGITTEVVGGSTPTPGAPQPSPARPVEGSGAITFQSVVDNLEEAEQMVYGTVFQDFNSGNPVAINHEKLQDFVATNSALTMENIEVELMQAASVTEDMQVTQDIFRGIMCGNAVSEAAVFTFFSNMGVDQVDSGDARSGLVSGCSELLGPVAASINQDKWDNILDSVLAGCDPMVDMQAFTNYTQRVARIIRIVHLAKA